MTALNKTQLQQVINELENLLFCDLVKTYNDYASSNYFELIHDNDEENINTLFDSAYDAAKAVSYGKYNPNDDYVMLDGYANAVSFSYQLIQDDNCPIDLEELAQWLINEDKLSDYDIDVVTLDDMLAIIEDNITDDEDMLKVAINYLGISTMTDEGAKDMNYNEWLISEVMFNLNSYCDYADVQNTMKRLGINYE